MPADLPGSHRYVNRIAPTPLVPVQLGAAGPPIWVRWLAIAVILAIFAFVWWINQVVARRLQKRIDEIDALTGER